MPNPYITFIHPDMNQEINDPNEALHDITSDNTNLFEQDIFEIKVNWLPEIDKVSNFGNNLVNHIKVTNNSATNVELRFYNI